MEVIPVMIRDLEWLRGQKYVTLVECEPGGHNIGIMIEKASAPKRRPGNPYVSAAVVVVCADDELTINGKMISRKTLGPDLHEHLVSICGEASAVINIGDTYFSDPGAEV